MILRVSRRTDIPAFYSDWFFNQLRQGYVLVPNPINLQRVARIELKPLQLKSDENLLGEKRITARGTVEGIVFWTKNPQPMLVCLPELKDYAYYFLYTLTGYPESIEAGLPPVSERITSFIKLTKYCPVIWRYDPILITDGIDVNWHIQNFAKLCAALKGCTTHCKISFVIQSYSGCSNQVHAPSEAQKHEILKAFAKIAKANNIQIEACAENGDWSQYSIVPSKCIDGVIFEKLLSQKYGVMVSRKKQKLDGQRKHCGCMPAVDIGRYDTCRHGCNYCYARKSKPKRMTDEVTGEIYERKVGIEFTYYN